jgi:hypothetical protein
MPLRPQRLHSLKSNFLFFKHLRFKHKHKFPAGGTFPTYPEIRGCAWDSDCRNDVKVQPRGFEARLCSCPLTVLFRWIELIRQIEHNMPLRSKRFHTLNSNNLFFKHLRLKHKHKFRAGGTFPTYPEIRGCAWDSDCRNAVKVQAWGFETQPLCCPLNGRFRWIELIRQIEHNTPLRSKRFHTLNSNNLFFSHLRFQHNHKFPAGGKLPTYPGT